MSKKNRNKADRPAKVKRPIIPFVERPFEGLPREAELVAMREILPLASIPVVTTKEFGSVPVHLVTILPELAAGLRRDDDVLLVAVQSITSSGDASLDIATNLVRSLDLQAGEYYRVVDLPEPGPRLQDVLDLSSFGSMELFNEPTFWMSEAEQKKPENKEALEAARDQLIPTKQIEGQSGAYWCRMKREFVRWVRPESADVVLNALARLRVAGSNSFDEAKFVGAFRAQGLLIPVWELQPGTEADELTKPLNEFAALFTAAIENSSPLTPDEKRARDGIVSRQVTLR